MSKTARTLMTFVTAIVAYLAVVDPIGVPQWVQGICAVLAVGFAAIGIIPPTMETWTRSDAYGRTTTHAAGNRLTGR